MDAWVLGHVQLLKRAADSADLLSRSKGGMDTLRYLLITPSLPGEGEGSEERIGAVNTIICEVAAKLKTHFAAVVVRATGQT